jgi:polar amino acid transport system substrate-binding protein
MRHGRGRPAVVALFAALLALAAASIAAAQESAQSQTGRLTVGVYESPPFVMKDGERFTGMSIDLWERLAGDLDLQADYVELDTVGELVSATANGLVDVAVTNLTITRERAESIDFTHPWFDAGLRVMVNEERTAGFSDVIAGLQSSGHLRAYAWIIAFILAATVLLTFFDRHFDKNFPQRWRDGIAESFYTVMSVATSGKPPSRSNLFGWVGRIWQGLWLVCGVAVLAYVTSSVTSVMTTLSLSNQINSVEDLPGRPVAVFSGSVAESYARREGIDARPFAHLDEAVEALVQERVVAVIADAPVLEYYEHNNPQQPVTVVGPIFEPDKYGFGLPQGSPLARPLTVELIGAHESDAIEEIRARYFGD